MKFSHELKIFFIILISTFLISSFSHFGVKSYEAVFSYSKGFPENSSNGPITISEHEEEEARELIELNPVQKDQIVNTITIPIEGVELQNISATLVVDPKSTFSFNSFLQKQGLIELDSSSIGLLSSGVYQAILPTNFQIVERHNGMHLPKGIQIGYEAKVDADLKWDLSFHNPNTEQYKIEIYSDGKVLIFDIVGQPFLYKYSIIENELKEFAPKVIKQYSPLLNPSESKITRNGQNGYYIELSRLTKDASDTIINQEAITKDYYPPVHQIEIVGLSNSVNLDESNSSSTLKDDANKNKNNSSQPNDRTVQNSELKNDSDADPLWGKPDEIEK